MQEVSPAIASRSKRLTILVFTISIAPEAGGIQFQCGGVYQVDAVRFHRSTSRPFGGLCRPGMLAQKIELPLGLGVVRPGVKRLLQMVYGFGIPARLYQEQ